MASPSSLLAELRIVWGADTSASPDKWVLERPSLGQCAVTALLFQEYVGGGLLRSVVNGESHYFNELNGKWFDLTIDQFDMPLVVSEQPEPRERDYVLSYPDTAKRWELLRNRLGVLWFGE